MTGNELISQNQIIDLVTTLDGKASIAGDSNQNFAAKNLTGNGSALTGLTQSQVLGLTTVSSPTFAGLNISSGGIYNQTSSSACESATIGSELLASGDTWSLGSGWSGTFSTGFSHSSGTATLTDNTLTPTSGSFYQITYTVTNRTAGSFTIAFGGVSKATISASGVYSRRATSTSNLVITPTTDFNGTVVISIKRITASNSINTLTDSTSSVSEEKRATLASKYNIFRGKSAGQFNTTGDSNFFDGTEAGSRNTQGYSNYFSGAFAGRYNETGNYLVGIGAYALTNNITGSSNFAAGSFSNFTSTTASNCVGIGAYTNYNNNADSVISVGGYAGYSNTTGYDGINIGYASGYGNTTGIGNINIGSQAARYIADGTTANQTTNYSICIGKDTKIKANGDTNEVVIGHATTGNGSNTATIGNTNLTDLYANSSGTATVNAGKFKLSALNTAPASATATGTLGEIRITSDYIYVCTATNTWKRTALSSW